ncbi:zinc-finger of the MIZ type in Nse subunit-domain-containing protein [Chaetomidium leptoderma]|uniref:peptidylprolyl isomerase n=1 Tax=Chaetomidium leptoderma TaxID=669021 RepID=A0AAN6VG62_9PEZI|nr:zinc-finger of the MIZ type in Nse subunit-domain-containing protein [Chaetomidium leptoderma]
MPRLLQRTRRPDATPSGRSGAHDRPLELPPYEPPSYPMDEKIRQKLASISSRETDSSRRQYEKHLTKSSTYLFESVGSINDILFARKRSLAHMAEKRRTRGDEDKNENEVSLEEYVAGLDAAITDLTDSSEEALRWLIDCRAELEDHPAVLEKVLEGLNAQQPRPERKPKLPKKLKRRAAASDDEDADAGSEDAEVQEEDEADGDDDAQDLPPLTGVKDLLEAARKAKVDEYDALSAHQRYAVNNDYISFKRNWHDSLHPEDQVPLPDPSTWFDEHGMPTKDALADTNEDDDLVVEREIIDLKCPLSLQIMKEPYSNHQCKHTFDKASIMEFIRSNGGMAKCPVCSKDLHIKDLYLDEVVLRKVKRAEAASRRGVDDTSDIEPEDDDDSSMLVGKSTNIKKERDRPRRRMEEIDQDDE